MKMSDMKTHAVSSGFNLLGSLTALLMAGGCHAAPDHGQRVAVDGGTAPDAKPMIESTERRRDRHPVAQPADIPATLLRHETVYDSTVTDETRRTELRAQFAALRPKVAPNRDPQKAGVWKVWAFAFRELDFAWTDANDTRHHAKHRYRDDEIDRLRRSLAGFAGRVWNYTDGHLRIDWELEVIDTPLTRLDGEHSFWPGPDACMPHLTGLKTGETDTIMVFAKAWGDPNKDKPSEGVPEMLLGGALGATDFTRNATYIGFNWGSGAVENEPDGEPMLHEWLHSAQWALENFQGYPRGLMFTSDGGRMEGEEGGDPCYRRKPGEPSWMGFYQHLMRDHVTRRMWRELTLRRRPDNVWIDTYCRSFLVLGPFDAAGRPDLGLDFPFIDEAKVDASPAPGTKTGERAWRRIATPGHTLDLTLAFGALDHQVAYVVACARSASEQAAQLRIGSDDGCKVWHNGRPVLVSTATRGAEPDQNIVPVTLQPGDNWLLMKVANGVGDWAAILRLTDGQGGPLPGLAYSSFGANP